MTNRILRGSTLQTRRYTAAILLAAICAASGVETATAAVELTGGASVGAEYNSNALQISDTDATPSATNGSRSRSDISKHLSANLGIALTGSGPVQAELHGGLLNADFDRFDTLTRRDHNLGGSLAWKPSKVFDISLLASENRTPVDLTDIGGEQATQQTARDVQSTLHFLLLPGLRIGLTPGWSETKTALPDAPDFRLRGTSGSVSLDFPGTGRLTPGIVVTQSSAKYSGIDNATRYHQQLVQGTLNYVATGFSTFTLAAGVAQRSTHLIVPTDDPAALANTGKTNAFTYSLNYRRQLSVKTGINAAAYRYFQQYDAGVNTSVGTGFNVGVDWAATTKFSASLNTAYTWSNTDGIKVLGAVVQREDLVRSYSMSLNYQAMRHFSVGTFVTRNIRNSSVRSSQFNGMVAGLELTATLH